MCDGASTQILVAGSAPNGRAEAWVCSLDDSWIGMCGPQGWELYRGWGQRWGTLELILCVDNLIRRIIYLKRFWAMKITTIILYYCYYDHLLAKIISKHIQDPRGARQVRMGVEAVETFSSAGREKGS